MGIPFKEFESIIAKIHHAFMAIPAGRGLFTPCNKILQTRLSMVFLQRDKVLLVAMMGCCTLLHELFDSLTRCCEISVCVMHLPMM